MTPTIETQAPPLPRRAVDARGRLLPLSPEERAMRTEAALRAIERIEARPDTDPPGIDLLIMQGMNESKPERPPFPELL